MNNVNEPLNNIAGDELKTNKSMNDIKRKKIAKKSSIVIKNKDYKSRTEQNKLRSSDGIFSVYQNNPVELFPTFKNDVENKTRFESNDRKFSNFQKKLDQLAIKRTSSFSQKTNEYKHAQTMNPITSPIKSYNHSKSFCSIGMSRTMSRMSDVAITPTLGFGVGNRFTVKSNDMPSPGTYEAHTCFKGDNKRFTFGAPYSVYEKVLSPYIKRTYSADKNPGPGTYNTSYAIGSYGKITLKPRIYQKERTDKSPSPDKYKPKILSNTRFKNITFGTGPRHHGHLRHLQYNPCPSTYTLNTAFYYNKNKGKCFSFGPKNPKFSITSTNIDHLKNENINISSKANHTFNADSKLNRRSVTPNF